MSLRSPYKKGYADLGDQGKLNFSERGATLPLTCGHEVAGIVENIGPLVKRVSIGELVLVFPWIGCGRCHACLDGIESDCMSMQIIGLITMEALLLIFILNKINFW